MVVKGRVQVAEGFDFLCGQRGGVDQGEAGETGVEEVENAAVVGGV